MISEEKNRLEFWKSNYVRCIIHNVDCLLRIQMPSSYALNELLESDSVISLICDSPFELLLSIAVSSLNLNALT